MMAKFHRPGINEIFLLSRHLRLEMSVSRDTEFIVSKIDDIAAVDTVSVDEDRHVLRLSYDASQLSIDDIEKVIGQYDITFSHDWWTRVKKSWYQFTDSNSKSSASHHPGCCNKPPRN